MELKAGGREGGGEMAAILMGGGDNESNCIS